MWETLRNYLESHPMQQGVGWSVLFVFLAVVVYLLLRKRVHARMAPQETIQARRRLLAQGIAMFVILAWVRVWLTYPYGSVISLEPGGELNVLQSVLWTFVVGMATVMIVRAVLRSLLRHEVEMETRHRIRQITTWLGVLVFSVAAIFIWGRQIGNIGVFLGIVGAGLALSMGETLLCIAGWAILLMRGLYDIGDRIEIDGRIGDVIGINLFHTSLLEVGNWVKADQSTGRLLTVPNSHVLRHAVYNYTRGFPFLWNEFSTVVTYESDWEAAKEIMLAEANEEADKLEHEVKRRIQEMQERYAIRYGHLRPIVYTNIAEHGVQLTLRYLSPVRQRRATTHRISEDILRAFLAHPKIDFAYATTRIFRNNEEGKTDLGGPPHSRPPGSHAIG